MKREYFETIFGSIGSVSIVIVLKRFHYFFYFLFHIPKWNIFYIWNTSKFINWIFNEYS